MADTAARAATLSYGYGPRRLDIFIEPTCPFSIKTFHKIGPLLDTIGSERLTITLWLHSQPWHVYSAVVTRCIAGALTLADGRDKAHAVLAAVADHREAFVFENHCRGPNRDATPNDIIQRLSDYSGIDLASVFDISDLDGVIKRHTRLARQNGVHGSPTFMLDGLITQAMSSGDPVADWAEQIEPPA